MRDALVAPQIGHGSRTVAGDVDVAERQDVGVRAVDRRRGKPRGVRGRGHREHEYEGDQQTAWHSGSR